jgi:predicted O-methyltransferase YrrM
MDVERFAAELPRLFDDFPRSEHPRGQRFDDIVATVPSFARENNLALLNLAASLLDPGESYVESGTYMGASLIAATRGNEGDFVAIDDFSFGEIEVRGRTLPPASRPRLEQNLARFGASAATILEGDTHELLESGALEGRHVGVYYHDAAHGEEERTLRLIEPYLAGRALLIVDDSDWQNVAESVAGYLAGRPEARMLLQIDGWDRGLPQWWEGVAVLAWEA